MNKHMWPLLPTVVIFTGELPATIQAASDPQPDWQPH